MVSRHDASMIAGERAPESQNRSNERWLAENARQVGI